MNIKEKIKNKKKGQISISTLLMFAVIIGIASIAAATILGMAPDLEDQIGDEVAMVMSDVEDSTAAEWIEEHNAFPGHEGLNVGRIEPEGVEETPEGEIRGTVYILGTPVEMYETARRYPEMVDLYGLSSNTLGDFWDEFVGEINNELDDVDEDDVKDVLAGGEYEDGDEVFVSVLVYEWTPQRIDPSELYIYEG